MQMQQRRARAQHAAQRAGAQQQRRLAAAARPKGARQQRVVVARNNWKVFGPTAEYSDGDAEFFRLTSQLSDQYDWFAPKESDDGASASPEQDQEQQQQQRVVRPEFGLSPREIAALGLTGTQRSTLDPVRGPCGGDGWRRGVPRQCATPWARMRPLPGGPARRYARALAHRARALRFVGRCGRRLLQTPCLLSGWCESLCRGCWWRSGRAADHRHISDRLIRAAARGGRCATQLAAAPSAAAGRPPCRHTRAALQRARAPG